MDLRTLIVGKLKSYREANNYSTYQLRKLERNKELSEEQKKPIAKINVTNHTGITVCFFFTQSKLL